MSNRLLIDTSFLYALYNADDEDHQRAVQFALQIKTPTLVPDVILPEITFLFLRDVGYHAIPPFIKKLSESSVQLQGLTLADLQRAQQIATTYSSAQFDLVDTCIMALSERLQITQVCTFDRRDFSIFRPAHCAYLELLP